jgi:4'-phosphopantetheinyl transferase
VIDPLRRGRLVLARASLRVILAQELNVTVREVRIHRSDAGRPALDGEGVPSFSLSHAGEWAAVAISSLARVGIDIEGAGRPISPTLIDRMLTPAEASSAARESRLSSSRAFLAHWTAKEACAKVLDGGLASNLHRLELGDGLTDRPRLLDHALADIEVRRLDLGLRLIGALAGIDTESSSVTGEQSVGMR